MSLPSFAQLVDGSNIPHKVADPSLISTGLKILYGISGAIAVLLLVVAALRYVIAAGDSTKVEESKRMIAYTLVGLLVITLAATLVEFVLKTEP